MCSSGVGSLRTTEKLLLTTCLSGKERFSGSASFASRSVDLSHVRCITLLAAPPRTAPHPKEVEPRLAEMEARLKQARLGLLHFRLEPLGAQTRRCMQVSKLSRRNARAGVPGCGACQVGFGALGTCQGWEQERQALRSQIMSQTKKQGMRDMLSCGHRPVSPLSSHLHKFRPPGVTHSRCNELKTAYLNAHAEMVKHQLKQAQDA